MAEHRKAAYCLATAMLLVLLVAVNAESRYEFKHSLRPPFYLGRGGSLPFWDFGGNTIIFDDFIRLTPTMQSQLGWLWNTVPVEANEWEVTLELQIGAGGKQGADGLAFWYVADTKQEGILMGSTDRFNGLGIIFDSFDNNGQGDNPAVQLLVNDGTKVYDASTDGADLTLARCYMLYRDKRIKARIQYNGSSLQVLIDLTGTGSSYQPCLEYPVKIQPGFYFGLTAATGARYDNHDIYSMSTFENNPNKNSENTERSEQGDASIGNQHVDDPAEQHVPLVTHQGLPLPNPQEPGVHEQQFIPQDTPVPPQPVHIPIDVPVTTDSGKSQPVPVHIPIPVTTNTGSEQPPVQPQRFDKAQQFGTGHSNTARADVSLEAITTLENTIKSMQQQIDSMQQQQRSVSNSMTQLLNDVKEMANARAVATPLPHHNALSNSIDRLVALLSETKSMVEADVPNLRTTLSDIKTTVSTMHAQSGNTGRELLGAVSDVSKKMIRVQNTMESAKREQAEIVADLATNKDVLVSKIVEGTSFGFWTYFLFFQAFLGVAFVWWKKTRDEANKKIL